MKEQQSTSSASAVVSTAVTLRQLARHQRSSVASEQRSWHVSQSGSLSLRCSHRIFSTSGARVTRSCRWDGFSSSSFSQHAEPHGDGAKACRLGVGAGLGLGLG